MKLRFTKNIKITGIMFALLCLSTSVVQAQKIPANVADNIHFREIGPTRQGGRYVDFAVVVKPASHPELVIQPLHTERIGLYEGEKGGSSEVIYYHPEMVLVEKILKSHKNWRRVPIANYEVLAHVGKRAGGKTLLPEPVASRVGGLDLVGEFIGEVPLALIYRYDRVKTRGFEFLKKGLLEILR
jgi:hypothetical protein